MTSSHEFGTLIVTGASRGIGAAIARLAGTRGYAVVVNFSAGEAEAKKVVDEILGAGGRASAVHADIGREQDIVRMFETVERELGPIKALVNNAAITGGFARVEEVTAESIQKTFAVNVAGAMLCAREAVRRMSTKRGGTWGDLECFFARGTHGLARRVGALRRIKRRD
jgi:NAD(P)-dependent dehydrogenase (short-subunit alcohol dehydrogenase family)